MFQKKRSAYKPFDYPEAFNYYMKQANHHWVPSEVSLAFDIDQWKSNRLTDSEKYILTQVQLFLANADTDIASIYTSKYLPNLPLPELQMMLTTFASMEAIHQHSYSYTIDELGMPESSYSAFLAIDSMREKHEWIQQTTVLHDLTERQRFLHSIAIGSLMGEGVQLFSAFVIILSFMRRGLMNGLGTLTKYIMQDEDLHTEGMTYVFNTIVQEHPEDWTQDLQRHVYQAAFDAIRLEDHFIDLVFQLGEVQDLTADGVKQYVRFLVNQRLQSVGLDSITSDSTNPFGWMLDYLHQNEHANFFEVRPTAYQKAATTGSWDDAWSADIVKKLKESTDE